MAVLSKPWSMVLYILRGPCQDIFSSAIFSSPDFRLAFFRLAVFRLFFFLVYLSCMYSFNLVIFRLVLFSFTHIFDWLHVITRDVSIGTFFHIFSSADFRPAGFRLAFFALHFFLSGSFSVGRYWVSITNACGFRRCTHLDRACHTRRVESWVWHTYPPTLARNPSQDLWCSRSCRSWFWSAYSAGTVRRLRIGNVWDRLRID